MSPVPPALTVNELPDVSDLLQDFRAAVSYLSFYPTDSSFVGLAVRNFHRSLSVLLKRISPLCFESLEGDLLVNGAVFPGCETVLHALEEKKCKAFTVSRGLTDAESMVFLRSFAAPGGDADSFYRILKSGGFFNHIAWGKEEPAVLEPQAHPVVPPSPPVNAVPEVSAPPAKQSEEDHVLRAENLHDAPQGVDPGGLFALVAEAWQMSRALGRFLNDSDEARAFHRVFQRFFGHLLDRVGTVSPELEAVQGWFQCPDGEKVDAQIEESMRALLATAVERGWTAVLYDPATSGLVSDALAHWGADGRHGLVEKTVEALSRGLQGTRDERELALTHLMDSRPWVGNTRLVQVILDRLTVQLSEESDPALYQKGLLIAWDLLEPAVEAGHAVSVLALLATLHLHADDPAPSFPERPSRVRQWILEKSQPQLVRRLVTLAQENGRLAHFPLLSMLAAPLLMRDFYAAGPEEVPKYLRAFAEMREQVQAVLVEKLPDSAEEAEVELMLLIMRTCGIDPGMALQLSAWVGKGSDTLKREIIETITDLDDPRGGPALRLALLDDSEDIAVAAVIALGKIGFKSAAPLMVKAVKMRKERGKPHLKYHAAVCECLGDFGLEEAVPYLAEQAKKPGLLGGGASTEVRVAAIRALAKFERADLGALYGELSKEKIPEIQEALQQVVDFRPVGN